MRIRLWDGLWSNVFARYTTAVRTTETQFAISSAAFSPLTIALYRVDKYQKPCKSDTQYRNSIKARRKKERGYVYHKREERWRIKDNFTFTLRCLRYSSFLSHARVPIVAFISLSIFLLIPRKSFSCGNDLSPRQIAILRSFLSWRWKKKEKFFKRTVYIYESSRAERTIPRVFHDENI